MVSRIVIGLVCAFVGIQVGTWNGRQVEREWSVVTRTVYADSLLGDPVVRLAGSRSALGGPQGCLRVADALRLAGWAEELVPVMVAIARVESGCNSQAIHVERSLGVFQLNTAPEAHPWISDWCARDSLCSAKAALTIFRKQGLSAWTAFRSGMYRDYLPRE